MGRGFEETAHKHYIGNKAYQDSWERIYGKTKTLTEAKEQEDGTESGNGDQPSGDGRCDQEHPSAGSPVQGS